MDTTATQFRRDIALDLAYIVLQLQDLLEIRDKLDLLCAQMTTVIEAIRAQEGRP